MRKNDLVLKKVGCFFNAYRFQLEIISLVVIIPTMFPSLVTARCLIFFANITFFRSILIKNLQNRYTNFFLVLLVKKLLLNLTIIYFGKILPFMYNYFL